mgnify:CR=1 FL=1
MRRPCATGTGAQRTEMNGARANLIHYLPWGPPPERGQARAHDMAFPECIPHRPDPKREVFP